MYTEGHGGAMSLLRLLIADDNPIFRHGLRRLLESEPDLLVVGEAADGREAVELARRLAPDVVLMDIRMPGLDGLDAARQIRTLSPHVRILVLSSYDAPTLRAAAQAAGVKGYLDKSVEDEVILAWVRHSPDLARREDIGPSPAAGEAGRGSSPRRGKATFHPF